MLREFGPSQLRSVVGLLPRPFVSLLYNLRSRGLLPTWLAKWAQRGYRRTDQQIPHGVGAGLLFNPGNSIVSYALGLVEPDVQAVLERHLKAGSTFYDIGANVGFFTVIGARLVAPGGRVHSFEPHSDNAAALRHNVALNGFTHVTLWEAAVSSTGGDAQLYLTDTSALATLRAPGSAASPEPSVTVKCVAVDELLAQGRLDPPDVVKIDVEGSEPDVLDAMARTLERYRPVIVCELHDTNQAVGAKLRALGYVVTDLSDGSPIESAAANAHVLALPR